MFTFAISNKSIMDSATSFDKLTLMYNSGPIPPPFCYQYNINIEKKSAAEYHVDLDLEYYDRDEVTEEEIFDEGFSMEDNCKWAGELPVIWGERLEEKLNTTNWKKKPNFNKTGTEFILKLVKQGVSELMQPVELRPWEMLAQEIIQTVFELSGKEAPLHIIFVSGNSKDQNKKADFTFSFAHQQVTLISRSKKNIEWEEGQKLLKYIFGFDYMPEESFDEIPNDTGNYISPGDGFWYELAPYENAKKDVITRIERLVETLKGYC